MQLGALLLLPSKQQAILEKYVEVNFLLRWLCRIRSINKVSRHMGYIPSTGCYVSLRHHVLTGTGEPGWYCQTVRRAKKPEFEPGQSPPIRAIVYTSWTLC
jgi:hypothetical protein